MADFLLEKFNAGLAPSTLAGYRTAIAKTLAPESGVDLGEDADLSALLHNFQLERPVSRNQMPQWDLSLVLNRLSSEPFEPLEEELSSQTPYLARIPLGSVMEACSWVSHNTFTSFYLRDLSWNSFIRGIHSFIH